jgi:RHS repeat-associated protein
MPTDKMFTGQRLDQTGLYYYGARYYDPLMGRFISADAIVQNFKNSQCLNRYSYCLNNPLKYSDPSGHILPLLAIVGIALLVVNVASVAYDLYQYNINPSDENAIYALADVVDPNPVPTRNWVSFIKNASSMTAAEKVVQLARNAERGRNAQNIIIDVFTRTGKLFDKETYGGPFWNRVRLDFVVTDLVAHEVKDVDWTAKKYSTRSRVMSKLKSIAEQVQDQEKVLKDHDTHCGMKINRPDNPSLVQMLLDFFGKENITVTWSQDLVK